jgi:protein TonB
MSYNKMFIIWGNMTAEQRQNRIITGFLLLSLLLHLLLLLVSKHSLFPVEKAAEPVYVEVRPPQPRDRELDLPIREELEKPRKKPAKRLAERDQVVEKEQAPEGKDTDDLKKTVRAPEPAPKTPPPQPKPRKEAKPKDKEPEPPSKVTTEGWRPQPQEKPVQKVPDLQTLTQISPDTLAQIETDWRNKYREDIARGDTVWMDSQQDILISFMRRFRNNIYNVWNYPSSAAQRNQEGTNLVRVTIDRKGNITDIQLLESSGHGILDEETIRAIRKGSSYGPLPRAYPNEDLKIMAFFQYHLSSSNKRSSRRVPGAIY